MISLLLRGADVNVFNSAARRAARAWVLFSLLAAVLPARAMQAIEHWQQANGARIYLVRSPSIPMLDVRIDFDAGLRREPAEQVGLVSGLAGMFNKGVMARADAAALDENAISQAWADLGASFGASASADRLSFSLRTLTEPDLLNKAVALAARQLGEPAFPAAVWERERQRIVANLRESYTRPASVASRDFGKAVYGGHPYGREMTAQTLDRVNVEHMRLFYAAHVSPCRARVSMVGALDRAQADALARALLARLPPVPCSRLLPLPPVAEVPPLAKASELRVPFKSTQAHLLIGQPGFKRDDPDFFALVVGNHILGGGGFTSLLTNELREKRGLTYGIYSYFSPGLHAGAFTIGMQTRADQVDQALGVVRQVLGDFVRNGPTEAQLRAAKDNLMGGFPLRLDSNAKLLDNVANIAWYELPLDYLQTWTQQVDRLTVADVRAALGRKLQPDRMLTVVVGGP
jgi:zinc protease